MKWKEIPNTDGLYLVSDEGKIFSVRSNKVLKNQRIHNGYWRIELNINGEYKRYFIHRLVAETFIPNPDNLPCVNHKDENPSNNHVSNLEWCTHKYNTNYGTCIERIIKNKPKKDSGEYFWSKKVYQFDLEGNLIKEYGSVAEAARSISGSPTCINKVIDGIMKKYKGYYWNIDKVFNYNPEKIHGLKKGAILQLDSEGKVIKRYATGNELEKDGYRQISVNRVCRGERNTYKGYKWKHEGENE